MNLKDNISKKTPVKTVNEINAFLNGLESKTKEEISTITEDRSSLIIRIPSQIKNKFGIKKMIL